MGFLGKQWVFFGKNNGVFKSNVFDTTSHMIYFDYKAYAFYQNNNTFPHRIHSFIGHVIQEL